MRTRALKPSATLITPRLTRLLSLTCKTRKLVRTSIRAMTTKRTLLMRHKSEPTKTKTRALSFTKVKKIVKKRLTSSHREEALGLLKLVVWLLISLPTKWTTWCSIIRSIWCSSLSFHTIRSCPSKTSETRSICIRILLLLTRLPLWAKTSSIPKRSRWLRSSECLTA